MRSTPRIKALTGRPTRSSRLRAALAIVLVALLTACDPVGALHSLYTEERIVFEPKLLGTWEFYDSGKIEWTWTFEQIGDEQAYSLTWREADSGETAVYRVVLVHLDGLLFLDAYPEAEEAVNEYAYLLPMHTFHRIWVDDDTLRLTWLDDDLLKTFLDERSGEIRHERLDFAPKIILTASTEELQRFVVRHAAEVFVTKPTDMLLFYRRENQAHRRALEDKLLLDPDETNLLAEIGQEHLQRGRYTEARETFERAVEADTGESTYHSLLGTAWLFLGDPCEARKHFQAALQLGDDSRTQFNLGVTYFFEHRFSEAAQAFKLLFQRKEQNNDTELLPWYLLALELTGNSQGTEEALQRLLRREWNPDSLDYLRGRLSETELLRHARTPEEQCEAEFFIGMRILAQGDRHAARAHFLKAAQSDAFDTLEYAAARAFL